MLEAVKRQLGIVPNMFRLISNSPAALEGYSEEDVRAVKLAGYSDAQVIEIIQHVALNTWTNYINQIANTDIDFPLVTARGSA